MRGEYIGRDFECAGARGGAVHWYRAAARRLDTLDAELDGMRAAATAAIRLDGCRATAILESSIRRLETEKRSCATFMKHFDLLMTALGPETREIVEQTRFKGRSNVRMGMTLYCDESTVWERGSNGLYAINAGLRAMEGIEPSGHPALGDGVPVRFKGVRDPQWRGGGFTARRVNVYHSIMPLWAAAPERIGELARQLEDPGADAARIAAALEWWLRVWDAIDASLTRIDFPHARALEELKYRDGLDAAALGAWFGINPVTSIHWRSAVADALRRDVPAEALRLTEWRYRLSRHWSRRIDRAIDGFDEPWDGIDARRAQRMARQGNRPRAIDWREVDKLMRDETYEIKLDRLIETWR